jgi:hypothetical protein
MILREKIIQLVLSTAPTSGELTIQTIVGLEHRWENEIHKLIQAEHKNNGQNI